MSRFDKIAVGLLVAIAIEGAVTTAQVIRIARSDFEMVLTVEEAKEIADEVNETVSAQSQAEKDMEGESDEW
jgi:hypothetical protein